MKNIFTLLFLFISISSIFGNEEEQQLRAHIFKDYNKHVRPVLNSSDIIDVRMGLGVQNLEAFNQKEESIDINLWVRLNWKDEYLNWDNNTSELTFLSADQEYTWVPDIELLNAASLPEVYTLNGGMNLYNTGDIMWSNPAVFKFSCNLDLKYFPFDTQQCSMKFSSWNYDNSKLKLNPHDDVNKQIDILDDFSHSEWAIKDVKVENYDETRACCPNSTFSTNEYTITLERFPHYYSLNMWMTISLVIVNFIIMLIKPDNISRTSTGVFIPLTILALQLTLSDKIPVVGYYTLMDYFFLCCFITSMICSIESGLVFALLTTKSKIVYKLLKNRFDLTKLIIKDKNKLKLELNRQDKHEIEINNAENIINHENISQDDVNIEDGIQMNQIQMDEISANNEFDNVIRELKRSKSYTESMSNRINETNLVKTKSLGSLPNLTLDIVNKNENENQNLLDISDKKENNLDDVIKTINYDDINLTLSYKEKLIFAEIERYVKIIDNYARCIIPFIFIIIISVIMNYN